MSGNSLASLLAWMKDESRLLGWGLVVALERRKTNLIVLQEYIKRFGVGSYIPPITGEVDIVADKRREMIHDFVMDVPVLSFENTDLNDSKAKLTMSVVGGSQLTLEKESIGWKVYKLDEIDPLQGPKLYLDLLLNQVPGDVEADGRVILDLSKSDNFRLTFAETPAEQRLGGDFFKDYFNKMKPEERIYPLGKIDRGTNELMRPQSFVLRTQASGTAARDPRSPEYGDGAILALIRTINRNGGDFPGENYKNLIPDDQGKDYSATVVFEKKRIVAPIVLKQVMELVQSDDVDYSFDQSGNLLEAIFASGSLKFSAADYTLPVTLPDGTTIDIGLKTSEFDFLVSTAAPLIVEISHEKISVHWNPTAIMECTFTTRNQEPGVFKARVDADILVEYQVDLVQDTLLLVRTRADFIPSFSFVDLPVWEENDKNAFWGIIALAILIPVLGAVVGVQLIALRLSTVFLEQLKSEASVSEVISEIIKLNFGQAIQGNEIYAPNDIGFFGRINPQQTSFLTTPTHPLIKQGGTQQFSTDPVVTGVQWKVETLLGDTGNPGTISASGLYQAPAATQFSGRFTRVRVTATAPGTGYYSSALVTIVASELSVHPLIQICDVGNTVELTAGVLGEGELAWSIKNAVPGESGELRPSVKPGGHYTYHQGPEVAKKTYVLDEIEVKNARTTQTRSVHVLAYKKMPMLEVRIDRLDTQQGLVQLSAWFDGEVVDAEWRLALGTGSIDSTGLYRAAPTSTQRFALIFAEVFFPPSFRFEGHLILPLPLVEFPARLRGEHGSNQTPKLTAAGSHDHGR